MLLSLKRTAKLQVHMVCGIPTQIADLSKIQSQELMRLSQMDISSCYKMASVTLVHWLPHHLFLHMCKITEYMKPLVTKCKKWILNHTMGDRVGCMGAWGSISNTREKIPTCIKWAIVHGTWLQNVGSHLKVLWQWVQGLGSNTA